ncbi:hypothetical protein EVAR_43307_1 [Eumeta japonica]|uniref:Uncharacterized protein n=1 Tax=Eumeta variegata TaxID=151549 RepID=A0A4C1WY30_EUMVA|nr:hypothetical protein EVAR_43307_1 [Eumeta japonica]
MGEKKPAKGKKGAPEEGGLNPAVIGAAVLVLLLLAIGAWFVFGGKRRRRRRSCCCTSGGGSCAKNIQTVDIRDMEGSPLHASTVTPGMFNSSVIAYSLRDSSTFRCSSCTRKRHPGHSLRGGMHRACVAGKSRRKRTPILKGRTLGGCPMIFLSSVKCLFNLGDFLPLWRISFGSSGEVLWVTFLCLRLLCFQFWRVVALVERRRGGDRGNCADTADAYESVSI